MLRDARAWHGGTPNLSQYTRAIPHPGLWSLPAEVHHQFSETNLHFLASESSFPIEESTCPYRRIFMCVYKIIINNK